jgi:hypothetical protein
MTLGLELVVTSPAPPPSDATNYLGGVADVLEKRVTAATWRTSGNSRSTATTGNSTTSGTGGKLVRMPTAKYASGRVTTLSAANECIRAVKESTRAVWRRQAKIALPCTSLRGVTCWCEFLMDRHYRKIGCARRVR